MIFSSGSLKGVLSHGLYCMLLSVMSFIFEISAGNDTLLIDTTISTSSTAGHVEGISKNSVQLMEEVRKSLRD